MKESGQNDFNDLIESVTNECIKYNAMIETITATFISVLFNVPFEIDDPKGSRIKLVENLSKNYLIITEIIHHKSLFYIYYHKIKYPR